MSDTDPRNLPWDDPRADIRGALSEIPDRLYAAQEAAWQRAQEESA